MTSIYGLVNPLTELIFYIGKSRDLDTRHYSHYKCPKTKTGILLKERGLGPVLQVLEDVEDEVSNQKEAEWINKIQSSGIELENIFHTVSILYSPEILWLKAHKEAFNLKNVAEQAGIPIRNLWNFCNDKYTLNQTWHKPLSKWIREFRK
jgi:hypothetical protein